MLSRTDFDIEGEVGEVLGKIASDYWYEMDLGRVFLEGVIVRKIDWLVLLRGLYITYL